MGTPFVELPLPSDVLVGKGRNIQEHSGNRNLKSLVSLNMEYYEQSSKVNKKEMTDSILRSLKAMGIRFLEKDSLDVWVEVPDTVAREKVSMLFRNLRKSALETN